MNAPITTDELRAAWAAMRGRPVFCHWPDDFDTAMADPVACRLVRIEATARRRMRPPPAAPPRPFTGFVPRALPSYDHKRAAAGDRD